MVMSVPAVGLSVLNGPEDAVIDIVFVHGLQGHPQNTWTWKPKDTSNKPESSRRHPKVDKKGRRSILRSVFSRSGRASSSRPNSPSTDGDTDEHGPDEDPAVYWPRDLLAADFPTARVMTFGYNTIVTEGYRAANQASLFAHARDLLYALEAKRRSAPDRPLVFIAHSLGGILTKEVLRRSEVDLDIKIKRVFESTIGVFFMGTPHRGSQEWASFGEGMAKLLSFLGGVDVNLQIVHSLLPTGPELDLCRESFAAQWAKRGDSLTVRTFQESKGLTGVTWGGMNKLIVPPDSSSLDHPSQRSRTINADHRMMCRFCGPDDPGYTMVKEDIAELVQQAEKRTSKLIVPINHVGWSSPSLTAIQSDIGQPVSDSYDEEIFKKCLDSLWFTEMEYRRSQIDSPHPETSKWLFAEEKYMTWFEHLKCEEHQGLLWIKGKPGAGKSTLMKKAFNDASAQEPLTGGIYASFFFHSRGNVELQKTSLGLFRSLWHQLLRSDEVFRSKFMARFLAKPTPPDNQAQSIWTLEELKDLFREALTKHVRPVMLFIDGLDECVETEIRDLVNFFRKLTTTATSNGARLSVCLSSRHYPHITVSNCPEITVEDENQDDISLYVHAQLFPEEQKGMYAEIREQIVRRAGGIFLWTVLVVRILLEDFDSGMGANPASLQERLDTVPSRLEELFLDLFKHTKGNDLKTTVFLIQVVLFASSPLKDGEMAQCLSFGLNTYHSLQEWKSSSTYIADWKAFEKRVRFLSRGLVEITSDHTVQFIHQSVRDFFLGQRGIKLLDKDLEADPAGKSHLAIIMSFLNLMRTKELSCLDSITDAQLWYMRGFTMNWFITTDKGRADSEHIGDLFPHQILFLWNDFDGCRLAWYVGRNIMKQLTAADKVEAPLKPALDLLLHSKDAIWSRVKTAISITAAEKGKLPNPPRISPVLDAFVDANMVKFVKVLLSLGAEVNEQNTDTKPLLITAAKRWEPEDLEVLLANGAKSDVRDSSGRTILHVFAERDHEDGVLKALSLGIDINALNRMRRTALHSTVLNGFTRLSEILLDRKANIDAKDGDMRTPLCLAVMRDDAQHVALLIKHGADLGARDLNGETVWDAAKSRPRSLITVERLEELSGKPAEFTRSHDDVDTEPMSNIRDSLEF
ncbi:hypothetical protein PFICI_06127 [Pestalotiopsis fici W106-1]|uniref:Nephrocystin 3-like N-terminal domain-containing protein n=1 Tax=Pestalotiopsis fici (strain W106-1 / CGMCC3.15140) TaxID=1229662 RepID=W3X4Y9_PESFW|nr:uncharacterized protein PFICI_06127 [Pestalotiopsis fici W106-1]ETS81125.1 hypothetical protein PFICI_06127 [Pestalotiopsis fici W106-1]